MDSASGKRRRRRPSLVTAAASILVRLPFGFSVPFLFLAVVWTFYLFHNVNIHTEPIHDALHHWIPQLRWLDELLRALFYDAVYIAGLLLAYNLAVLTNWLLVRYGLKQVRVPAVLLHRPPQGLTENNRFENTRKKFENTRKIGIVLAGGGAKGAFQAGAMKAIYRFLAEGNALQKVKVISATSIGSWNALFWLADLIKSEKGWEERSPHEQWWRKISLRSLIAPSWYLPGFRNAFFTTAPWQRSFDEIFGQDAVRQRIADSGIHFYLTCSHVRSGSLECTTNNLDARDLPRVKYNRLDSAKDTDTFLEGVKAGVFASMDLPPLFPYMEIENDFFEDGGVIDNLPIMFAAIEFVRSYLRSAAQFRFRRRTGPPIPVKSLFEGYGHTTRSTGTRKS